MTLQQMEYILALNKYRHFVLAAESCGVTQPTLSAMIQKLEEELDVKIFNRDRKEISPTTIGLKIIQQMQTTLNEAQRIKEVVNDEQESLQGTLRIGIIPTIAPYLIPDFIYQFKLNYPNVDVYIEEMKNETLLKEVETGNIDIAILATKKDLPSFYTIPLYTEKFVGYFSKNCKCTRSTAPNEMPLDSMWILREGHCTDNEQRGFCTDPRANHIYKAGSIETLIRIVDKNGGFTIIPELHVGFLSEQQRANLKPLEGDSPKERTVSLLIKEDYIREKMVNAVCNTIKDIIPPHMIEQRLKNFSIKLR